MAVFFFWVRTKKFLGTESGQIFFWVCTQKFLGTESGHREKFLGIGKSLKKTRRVNANEKIGKTSSDGKVFFQLATFTLTPVGYLLR